MEGALQYIKDVQEGNIVVGEFVGLAVAKHFRLLEQAESKGYYFDEEAAKKAISLIKLFRHTKGDAAGKLFQLLPWQEFQVYYIFGWKIKATKKRLVRKAYIEVAKKNGKTELAAAIGLLLTFFEKENGAESYITAKKRGQAEICYRSMSIMIKYLRQDFASVRNAIPEPNTKKIYSKATDSFVVPLSKDADGSEGVNVHCSINDEVHTHPNGKQIENIESAMVARSQPLSYNITTAGTSIGSYCFNLRKTCIDVLKQIKEDDTLFTIIYTLDEDDDWEDKANWPKANPSLGIAGGVSLYALSIEYKKAKNEGISKENYFKTRHLSLWISSSNTWIKDNEFKKLLKPALKVAKYKKRIALLGLDLSSNFDVSALAVLIPPKKKSDKFRFFLKFYLPLDNITVLEEKHKAPYQQWAREGWITLTAGDVIDYKAIRKDVLKFCDLLDVQALGYDRKFATSIITELEEEGVPCFPVAQSTTVMNAPIVELERLVRQKLMQYDNPILRWMMTETSLYTDTDMCKKVDRRTSGTVDGVVAALMAKLQYLIYLADNPDADPYAENGLTFV